MVSACSNMKCTVFRAHNKNPNIIHSLLQHRRAAAFCLCVLLVARSSYRSAESRDAESKYFLSSLQKSAPEDETSDDHFQDSGKGEKGAHCLVSIGDVLSCSFMLSTQSAMKAKTKDDN